MTVASSSFYVTGGTLPPAAPSYVTRQADEDLYAALRHGDYAYVLNSRQMGKSSLCVRTIERLKQEGYRTAFVDLTRFGGKNLTPEQWYAGMLNEIGRGLNLRAEFLAYWKAHPELSPLQRLFGAVQEVALAANDAPHVIFIDEIDVTRSLSFSTDEFFAAIRQLYVGRVTDPILSRLVICLLGTASPTELIQDTRVSPFNIGKRIDLKDFTAEEARPLAQGLAGGQAVLDRVLYWTGGHPYLTQRLCRAITEEPGNGTTTADVDRLCNDLFLSHRARESDDNLAFVRNRLLKSEVELAALLELYGRMRAGKRVPDDETNPLCSVVKLSGVARVEDGLLKVRNRIYEHVFDRAWVVTHLPDAEVRRQKQAFQHGLAFAGVLSGIVLAIIGGLAVWALYNAHRADANAKRANEKTHEAEIQRDEAQHLNYIANMNLIPSSYEQNDFGRIQAILDETQTSKYRGFEWAYWNRLSHLDSLTIKGDNRSFYALAVSPDGKRVITVNEETASIKELPTCRELLVIKGLHGIVHNAAFSLDGGRVVISSDDKNAKVWDIPSGRETCMLKGHQKEITSIAFSPDGLRIVTGSYDNTARLWDAKTGSELLAFKGHGYNFTGNIGISSVAFSHDGKRIVTGNWDNTASIWDAASGREMRLLPQNKKRNNDINGIISVAISPDGKRIVTGHCDHTAKIWDVATGRERLILKGHSDGITSVAFSLDGKRIVTGSNDRTAKIWNADFGRLLSTLRGHSDYIMSGLFLADGTHIVTLGADNTIKVWDTSVNHDVRPYYCMSDSVAFSPDSKRILAGSFPATATIMEATTGRETLKLSGPWSQVKSVAFSPDDARVATCMWDKTVKIWDALTGRNLHILKGHSATVYSAAFSPDGKRVFTGSQDGTAKMWEVTTGHEIFTCKASESWITEVAFSSDGMHVATASFGDVKIWDAHSGRNILAINNGQASKSVAFSPDGKRIVTGSNQHTAIVWDAITGIKSVTLEGHSKTVLSVAFSPDGKRIVTGSEDHTAKIWDASLGHETLTLRHIGEVNFVTFSPDGNRIATVSASDVRIWDAQTVNR